MTKTIKIKKAGYIIIILVTALIFSSCQDSMRTVSTEIELEDGSGTGILASNNAVDFYFYYPANWIMHRNDLMIMVYVNDEDVLESNAAEGISDEPLAFMTKPNISAFVFSLLEGYDTIDDYWNNFAVPSLEDVFQDISSAVVQELTLTVDDIPAKKYTYTAASIGINYKFSQIIFFRNRQVYTLTYTATENKFDAYAAALDTVAETFTFK